MTATSPYLNRPLRTEAEVLAARRVRPHLVETCHGTVCGHCRLWADLCTCRPGHPMRQILGGTAARLDRC